MPRILSVAAMLVAVFAVALGGAVVGNAVSNQSSGAAVGLSPDSGSDGHDGDDGRVGADGRAGVDGRDGSDGRDGAVGPAGAQGDAGERGQVGPPGPAGPAGPAGQDGVDGTDGADGNVNVRLVEKEASLFNHSSRVALEFSPRLGNEKWLVETRWTPVFGAGSCSVVTGAGEVSTTSGDRLFVNLEADNTLELRCKSAIVGNNFAVNDAWMLATRVTG